VAPATDLTFWSAADIVSGIRSRDVSATEVTRAVLERIDRVQPRLNAFTYECGEDALALARAIDVRGAQSNDDKPLLGVPVSIKDNIAMGGAPMTVGSRLLKNNVPERDSVIVERLRNAGAIIVARTNTPEFAWRGSTDNRLFGETANPWDSSKTAGGSSGGAAAAVATGCGPLALGTDGAGSIRIPASFCGTFGIKPSVGRVAFDTMLGMMETAASAGPITRTVRDAAMMLDVIAGPDNRDRMSLPDTSERFEDSVGRPIDGLRIAWSANLGHIPVESEVVEICRSALPAFEEAGAHVSEYDGSLPDPAPILEVFYASVQAGAHGRRPEAELAEMDSGLVEIAKWGAMLSATDVGQMWLARNRYWDAMRQVFDRFDVLVTPTVAVPPFDLGIVGPTEVAGESVTHLGWTLAYPFNLTGQPAASVPCGFTRDGLPVGLQIVGNRFAEGTVLQAAAAYEAARPWGGVGGGGSRGAHATLARPDSTSLRHFVRARTGRARTCESPTRSIRSRTGGTA
jgi:aspartyl-tRNA(Asn)/glutamyl-tRNA(Gln) amidotransferase subunit A